MTFEGSPLLQALNINFKTFHPPADAKDVPARAESAPSTQTPRQKTTVQRRPMSTSAAPRTTLSQTKAPQSFSTEASSTTPTHDLDKEFQGSELSSAVNEEGDKDGAAAFPEHVIWAASIPCHWQGKWSLYQTPPVGEKRRSPYWLKKIPILPDWNMSCGVKWE